ncbi:unnamed protein product, partial [Rotaria magnacalcarata]
MTLLLMRNPYSFSLEASTLIADHDAGLNFSKLP